MYIFCLLSHGYLLISFSRMVIDLTDIFLSFSYSLIYRSKTTGKRRNEEKEKTGGRNFRENEKEEEDFKI